MIRLANVEGGARVKATFSLAADRGRVGVVGNGFGAGNAGIDLSGPS